MSGCSIAGGELFERIVDDNFEHTEPASVHYMQQILEGVAFMHQQNILHLDLKPENIVCVDKTGTFIKIIDFGLASKIGECDEALEKPFCGIWNLYIILFGIVEMSSREIQQDYYYCFSCKPVLENTCSGMSC